LPEQKDIVSAVIGASSSLAGLLLVFCGFLFAQASSFPPATTDDAVIEKYRNTARAGLWPFLISLAIAAIGAAWMLWPSKWSFAISVGMFFVLLGWTGVYAMIAVRKYL
jgi:hypothetical protein